MAETVVDVSSLFGAETRQPLVAVRWGDRKPETITPAEARDLAANLVAAAEASEQDAFLFEFAQGQLACDDRQAAAFLFAYREWRRDRLTAFGAFRAEQEGATPNESTSEERGDAADA